MAIVKEKVFSKLGKKIKMLAGQLYGYDLVTVLDSLKHSAFKKGAISSINELINMTGHTAYDEPDYHREFLYLDSDDAYNIGEWNEGKKDFHHHSWKDYVSYIELTSWVYCDEIVQLNDKGMDVMYVTER